MQSTLSVLTPQAQQPGHYRLRFGAYAGSRIDALPVDYLNTLRRFPALWDSTRRAVEGFLRHLARNPGEASLAFGKHQGSRLDETDTRYLDWCLGQGWLGGATRWLIGAALGRRAGRRLICDYRGRVIGRVEHLAEVEDRPEPFESKGFTPGEQLYGQPGKKPSVATLRRPRDVAAADDELFGQKHGEPPAPVAAARRDRNRCYWAKVQGEPTLKADDSDADRVRCWDRCLEAAEGLATAPSAEDLGDRYAAARRLVELLAQAEHWDDGSNPLLDELDASFLRRQEQLAGEVTFTDAERRVEPASRNRGRAVPESARVHELVRRMRGARSRDALDDVAFYVRRHKAELSEAAVAQLRTWYAKFRSELVAAG